MWWDQWHHSPDEDFLHAICKILRQLPGVLWQALSGILSVEQPLGVFKNWVNISSGLIWITQFLKIRQIRRIFCLVGRWRTTPNSWTVSASFSRRPSDAIAVCRIWCWRPGCCFNTFRWQPFTWRESSRTLIGRHSSYIRLWICYKWHLYISDGAILTEFNT